MKTWLLVFVWVTVATTAKNTTTTTTTQTTVKPTNKTTEAKTTPHTTPKPVELGPKVNVTYGSIEGFYLNNKTIAGFQGIPYATPPVGINRFKPPKEQEKLNGTLKAMKFGKSCMQPVDKMFEISDMDEDCLTLNVYTPSISPKTPMPVMVYIHGGGFEAGSSKMYGGELISGYTAAGVVIVTINYRLGVFGFLAVNNSELPGNLGLWDQIQALKWVQKEIKAFGGDPAKVTIFGESAGGASASLLTYSPKAKGLFIRAITQSGTASDYWAIDGNQGYYYNSSRIVAVQSGCVKEKDYAKTDAKKLAACLQSKNATLLLQLSTDRKIMGYENYWAPIIDGCNGVLPMPLHQLREQRPNNVSVLMGTNRNEGLISVYEELWKNEKNVSDYSFASFNETLHMLGNHFSFGPKAETVRELLDFFYRGSMMREREEKNPLYWIYTLSQAISDRAYFAGANRELWSLVEQNVTAYAYSFDYISDAFPYPVYNKTEQIKGVSHAMDLFYLFPGFWNQSKSNITWKASAQDNAMSNALIKAWTSFAISGNPGNVSNITWSPSTHANHLSYLRIQTGKDTPTEMRDAYHTEAYQLWFKVIPQVTGSPPDRPTPPPPKPEKHYSVGYFIGTWLLLGLLVIAVLLLIGGIVKARRESAGYGALN